MPDFDDFDFDRDEARRRNADPERDRQADEEDLPFEDVQTDLRRRTSLPFAWIAVALVAALAGLLFVLRPGNLFRSADKPTAVAPTPPSQPAASTTPPPEPEVALPPLAESDAFVREQAKNLSTHPQLASWLAAQGLMRTLTVSVQNIAEGRSPAPFLRFVVPSARFSAIQKAGRLVADPKSHAAYDDFADGISALDAAECARVYRLLLPLFGAAYAELGYPAADFPKALARALDTLRETPVPDGEITLQKGRVFLEFADPQLEALNFAQKQLLRMGPRNLRLIQAKAAEVARALETPTPGPEP